MKEKGVTQVEIAEATNVRRPSFSEWKKTGVVPAGDVCYKIAQYLGTTIEYLISGTIPSNDSNIWKEKYTKLVASITAALDEAEAKPL